MVGEKGELRSGDQVFNALCFEGRLDSCSALSVEDRRGLAALSRPHVSLQCCQSCPGSTLYLVGISSLLLVPEWCLWLICCETDHFDHAGSVPCDRLSYHPDGPGV